LPPLMNEDNYSSAWMIVSSPKSIKYLGASYYNVPHGAHAVELVSGKETVLVQDVPSSVQDQVLAGDAGDGCAGSRAVQTLRGAWELEGPVPVHGDRESNAAGVRQHGLQHQVRWHALWAHPRRRLACLHAQPP
jgi:hypothetical protein